MHVPSPIRAAIGLAATAADEARHLPSRAIELPMLAVSTALQVSMRAQQRYARLTARGDEVLRGTPSDEPPAWATFDDPVDTTPPTGATHVLDASVAASDETADAAAGETTGETDTSPTNDRTHTNGGPTKAVRPPRHRTPSRFDAVDDPADDIAEDTDDTDPA